VLLGLLTAAAGPVAAQSANRTPPNVPITPAKGGALATETEAGRRCRVHCEALAASFWHVSSPRPSVAERAARQSDCAKRMSQPSGRDGR
jgi:hypothetical protein